MSLPLITHAIPEQAFEKVRDKIGIILLAELERQKELQGLSEDISIYRERMVSVNDDELLYINVILNGGDYGTSAGLSTQGQYTYFIDAYALGMNRDDLTGSEDSSNRLGKYVGMIRYILSSDHYRTLGFAPGMIGGRYIENFATSEPATEGDSQYVRMARMTLSVRIQENNAAWSGIELLGTDAAVKLELTDRGFRYTWNKED